MNDRRNLLGTAIALGLGSVCAMSPAVASSPRLGSSNSATARALRLRPLGLHAGSHGGADAPRAIHRNFARLVEHNFARLAPSRLSALWHDLRPAEAAALVRLYDASVYDAGGTAPLLEILAERGEIDVLARAASAFGAERLYAATAAAAPAKLPALEAAFASSDTRLAAQAAMNSGPTIDYTLHEIYLSYRTAPVGSLSAKASVYMTVRYASPQLLLAWGTGYAAGSAVAPLIQTYAPAVWNGIGATVHHSIELLGRAYDSVTTARYEREGALDFQLSGVPFYELQNTGGDYGVVWNWHRVYTGGNIGGNPFCTPLFFCPPMDQF
jgi:hypothetical protein